MASSTLRRTAPAALALVAACALARSSPAQVAVTIDWQGPTISKPDPLTSAPLTEADVLVPAAGVPGIGPLPPPRIWLSGQALGLTLYSACAGHPPGTPCGIEVDSLSHGFDAVLTPAGTGRPGGPPLPRIWFSVDEYAKGHPLGTVLTHPQVSSEALFGEAASDLFVDTGLPGGPLPPAAMPPSNVAVIDGDGLPSPLGFSYPGIGLVEPNPPSTQLPNPGDNVDGLDRGFPQSFPPGGVFFSLDGEFPDPLSGLPSSGSAQHEGVSGADVLRTPAPGQTKVIYAPALLLGLDRFGPGTDDLDALILRENGDMHFQPSLAPYDWVGVGDLPPTDMLVFSVRRGSAVIGRPDSIFGLPIEPGDLLIPPVAGGVSPFPGLFVAAENLGLATVRSGTAAMFGDDVDALDADTATEYDCNGNG